METSPQRLFDHGWRGLPGFAIPDLFGASCSATTDLSDLGHLGSLREVVFRDLDAFLPGGELVDRPNGELVALAAGRSSDPPRRMGARRTSRIPASTA